jgi:hypothetical protein
MDVFVVRCVVGDLDVMAVVEVSVSLVSRRRSSQGIGARASEGQARRPSGFAIRRPAMVCGLGR